MFPQAEARRDRWWIVIIISRRPNKGPAIKAVHRWMDVCVNRVRPNTQQNSISQTPSLIFFGRCQWLPQSNLKHNLILEPHKFIMGGDLWERQKGNLHKKSGPVVELKFNYWYQLEIISKHNCTWITVTCMPLYKQFNSHHGATIKGLAWH